MTNRDLAAGAFRAWGVAWLITTIASLPVQLPLLWPDSPAQRYPVWQQIVGLTACSLAAGGFLIAGAGWLAQRVFPEDRELRLAIDAAVLQSVLFSVLGVYFVVDGLTGAARDGWYLFQQREGTIPQAFEQFAEQRWQELIGSIVRLVAGILLFLGSGWLRDLRQRLSGREAGAPSPASGAGDGG